MHGFPILSLMTFLPLVGAGLLLLLRGDTERVDLTAKRLTLLISSLTFLLSLAVMVNFDPNYVGDITPWLSVC